MVTERPGPPVQVVTDDEPAACTRCGDDGLLAVRVPRGRRTVNWVLCSGCDRDQPGAAALITFFHVHGRVDDAAGLAEFSRLLQLWINELRTRPE